MSEAASAADVEEVHILWTSEGMSCDGDTVSITAASQPAIEDVVLGRIPGLPAVHLHNKVLSPLNGDEFMAAFHRAARRELGSWESLQGKVIARCRPVAPGLFRRRAAVANTAPFAKGDRDAALRRSLVSTHVVLRARHGRFITLTDPLPELDQDARRCAVRSTRSLGDES